MTLQSFFEENKKVAVALSGGVDSILLMHMAKKYGADVMAYFAKTEFQPDFELRDAQAAADSAGVSLCVIEFSVLEDENVIRNGADRCYFCKRGMLQIIKAMACSDGYDVLCDGTNASDNAADRAGMRALSELGVISPLKICGMTKKDIRAAALEAGLSVWDKPAFACLATRIKCGDEITNEKLLHVCSAEEFLAGLGFSDFRVRAENNRARLEFCRCDFARFEEKRAVIYEEMKKHFDDITVDSEARDEKLID